MKKMSLTLIFCLTTFCISAQDYLISFSGTGESNTVLTVLVENMTQNKNLTLNGKDILRLTSTITDIPELYYNKKEGFRIYPNPMNEFSIIEFSVSEEGPAKIELFDMMGRKLTQTQNYLNKGRHSYRLTGVGNGVCVLKVTSGNYLFSASLISVKKTKEKSNITYQNSTTSNDKVVDTKSSKSEILMQYTEGDLLKFTATGGVHKSVLVDVITQSKNVNFPFYKCTDLDNKNYATVKIGNQIWMAENFAYLPTVCVPSHTSLTSPEYYVYNYSGTDVATAKATAIYTTYGVLYNWPAAIASCPTGWHLPSDSEWTILENYLIASGFNYDGTTTGNKTGKSLATSTNWRLGMGTGVVGSDDYPAYRNKTGFSGLPSGNLNYAEIIYFNGIELQTQWWSSNLLGTNNAWYVVLGGNLSALYHTNGRKSRGNSVRYIKD